MMKAAIFDMDGTLVDSMGEWMQSAYCYLSAVGIQPPPDLQERVVSMSMARTVGYLQELGAPGTKEEMLDWMNNRMAAEYRERIPEKPGSLDFIRTLHKRGIHTCVLTATDRPLAELVLGRMGIKDCFEFLLSCGETGLTKRNPKLFEQVVERLGFDKADIVVFEDALYAVASAKQAGLRVVAVSDRHSQEDEPEIRRLADQFITHFNECNLDAL